ncbi:8996_t:CDS:2 [Ambispora leptoticha]|uniref:8996_t:CDS:1 n=1 Tax=Ambispora leptoticha TaxID=144679 RepID=A0A9N9CCS7_9GLOM|nr:8996_t:CDS:2 [Ambispora leptoticha]
MNVSLDATTTATSSALLWSSSPRLLSSAESYSFSLDNIDNPYETNNYGSRTTNSYSHEKKTKLAPIPTNSHPLNHELSTSPMSPTFFYSNYGKENESSSSHANIRQRRAYASLDSSSTDGLNEKAQYKRECRSKKELARKTVIVHEVKKTDTLAGIALFYGIELPILKKANKLWTNDSIHMHKYLYIPLDECKFDDNNEWRTTVILENDRIHISKNNNNNYHSSFTSDSSRPSMSSPSSSPSSSPFTFYDRETLLPGVSHQTYEFCHDRKLSNVSTSTIWSTTSNCVGDVAGGDVASTSKSLSSTSTTNLGFTSAEIQELSSAQLSYFPPHKKNNGTTLAKNPNTTLDTSIPSTIIQPSPVPISHYQKNRRRDDNTSIVTMPRSFHSNINNSNISFVENPSKIVDKLITTLDAAGEKYWGRSLISMKLAINKRRKRIDGDSANVLGGIWSNNDGRYRGDSTELRSSSALSSNNNLTRRNILFASSFEDGRSRL